MSLAISTSASSPVSTASSTSPAPPATPLTPSTTSSVAFNLPGANQAGPVRRKPSRRANTAERRATHNAVERQRRETLNGRFLDLAALLPNLASVRRPSKSAIVNSSIAVIHTQRRARCIAARELRLLKLEADALRAEVNEWRGRSGMASADEPLRSREFEELVSGGLEEAEENLIEEERRALEIVKEGLRLDASGLGADALAGPFAFNMTGNNNMMFGLAEDDEEDSSDSHSAHIRPGSQGSVGSVPSLPMTIPVPRASTQVNTPTSAGPIIFDPTAALLQSHPSHTAGINAFGFDGSFDVNAHPAAQHLQFNADRSQEKLAAWNAQLSLLAVQQQQQQQYAAQHNGFYSDDGSISSSLGSNNGVDLHQMQQNALRSRSSSTIPTLATSPTRGTMTPPSSAPATATTYAEASGDVFNAAYGYGANGWKTHGKELMVGGGNGFGATMGLFM